MSGTGRTRAALVAAILVGSAWTAGADDAAPPPEPPVLTVGEDGVTLSGGGGAWKLRLGGLVQIDRRTFPDGTAPPGAEQFLVRRARIDLSGTLARRFDFRILPEFAGATTTLLDAWLRWNVRPSLGVVLGKVKLPVGLERSQAPENSTFSEFSYPTALVPNRDVGVAVAGSLAGRRAAWSIGVYDGTPDGGSVASGSEGTTVVWRVLASPFAGARNGRGLGFGIAGTTGRASSTAPAGYRTVGQQAFFAWRRPASGTTGVVVDGAVRRAVPQLYWYRGPFGVLAEYAASSQELSIDGVRRTIRNTAWEVTASWVVTGEDATFRGVKPAGAGGAWQVSARYTGLDVDRGAFPRFADPAASARTARTVTVGASWYGTPQVRLLLDVSRTGFDGVSGTRFARETAVIGRAQFRF